MSHVYQSSTTALVILQSLVFQLAIDSTDIQSILTGADERSLVGKTAYVSDLLKMLLKTAGPTYIVLDGVDEMEADERSILLRELAHLDDCPETRMLVSCRPEDDISRVLETKATSLRVDKRNSDSIKGYINTRLREWNRTENFDKDTQVQLQYLLSPLAEKAAGRSIFTPTLCIIIVDGFNVNES